MPIRRASAKAHPNIALIKYWGKRAVAGNLPAVDSLSITLGALQTSTTVTFDPGLAADRLILNGQEAPGEVARLTACLDALRPAGSDRALVESSNDFPTGAGLASSASGYAAVVTAAAAALGLAPDDERRVSAARIGSGSAPRSLFGGFALLENKDGDTRCRQVLAAEDWPLSVAVAVISEGGKAISSRDGMELSRRTSPFYPAWLSSHRADLDAALRSVSRRDFGPLGELAEHSCLKMHAVMMSSRPPLMYWSPTTLACMQSVQRLREGGVPVFFTIDAGPQLKAVCLPEALEQVVDVLGAVPGVLRIIAGGLGEGARLTSDG
jgi:diphosphomevalonate decarboxylase